MSKYRTVGWELSQALQYAEVEQSDTDRLSQQLMARFYCDRYAAVLWLNDRNDEQTIDIVSRDSSGAFSQLLVSASSDWTPPHATRNKEDAAWLSGFETGTTPDHEYGQVRFTSGLSEGVGIQTIEHFVISISTRTEDRRDGFFVGRVLSDRRTQIPM